MVEGASAGGRGMVSNAEIGRGVSEGASARDRVLVDDVEIGSTRGRSRSARMFDGHVRLDSPGVSNVAERENVRMSMDAEIGKGVSNLRSVGRAKVDAGRIAKGVSNVRQPMMLKSNKSRAAGPRNPRCGASGVEGAAAD